MPLPNQVTDSGPVDRNFRDLDQRLEKTVHATDETTVLRIIRGRCNTATTGTILQGSGFSISRPSTGRINLTWTPAFSSVPAVVATGEAVDECFLAAAPTTTTGAVQLANTSGVATDGIFDFIAIGPA